MAAMRMSPGTGVQASTDTMPERREGADGSGDSTGVTRIVVSVVVPTYKRPHLLDRCLTALRAQPFDPEAFEIIVADDEPSDRTKQVVDRHAGTLPWVRYVPVTRAHGPAAARNMGWRAAQGDIIAFTDDDCIPMPEWLATGYRSLAHHVAAVTGRVVVPRADICTDYEFNVAGLERSEFLTANCFCRREALVAVGGFDERFTRAFREDSDLQFGLLSKGYRIVKAPQAVVIHPIRPAPWGISLGQQRQAMFNALLYKKHPRRYREEIQAAPPWSYYATVGAILLAAFGLFSKRRGFALGGLALWASLTGRLCRRRLAQTSKAPSHVCEMVVTSAAIPPLAIFWRLYGAIRYRVWFF